MGKVHAAPQRGKICILVDGVPCSHPDEYVVPLSGNGWRCASCGNDVPEPDDVMHGLVLELLPGGEP